MHRGQPSSEGTYSLALLLERKEIHQILANVEFLTRQLVFCMTEPSFVRTCLYYLM